MDLLHEGKAKKVFQDDASSDNVIIEFTDNVTAGDGEKHDIIQGKGKLACDLSDFFLRFLAAKGIDTHLIKRADDTSLRCKIWNKEGNQIIITTHRVLPERG